MTADIVDIESGKAWAPLPSTPSGYVNPTMVPIGAFSLSEMEGLGDVYRDLELGRRPEIDMRDLQRSGTKMFHVRERDGWNTVPYALVYRLADIGVDIKYFSAVKDAFSTVVELAFNRRLKGC